MTVDSIEDYKTERLGDYETERLEDIRLLTAVICHLSSDV